MSFVCWETNNHWEIGWESTVRNSGSWMQVETADTREKAFQICNYLNGGMPLEGMNVLNRLTGLKLVSKSKGEK